MDYSHRLEISYYQTIAAINEEHHIYLAKHQENNKICIKKILDIYNLPVYEYLKANPITGIPRIIDFCEDNGKLILIEEYISGTPLDELMKSKRLSVDFIHSIMCELCSILSKLHRTNPPIIHRDIKPSNIIITPYNHVVLLDFNAAKYLTNRETEDTVLLGTKGYAAPEQYGFGSSTPQTDIYACGVLLRELMECSGFKASKYDQIIFKCIQMNPVDRFKSIEELKKALEKKQPMVSDKTPASSNSFLPPGFRTKTPWKMLLAVLGYLLIFWLCATLEIENTWGFELTLYRIATFLILLSMVLGSCNYLNLQKMIPLCRNDNIFIRVIGILLLDVIVFIIGCLLLGIVLMFI